MAAWVASLASRQRLSELVDGIPEYPIVRGNADDRGIRFDARPAGKPGSKLRSKLKP